MKIAHAPLFTVVLALGAPACGGDDQPSPDAGVTDVGTDGGPGKTDGGADAGPDAGPDGGPGPDGGDVVVTCANDPIPVSGGATCSVVAGTGAARLVRGAIVAPEGLLENGHLLIDQAGKIACAACDCSEAPGFAEATVIACPEGVVSPGIINAHEHITFGEGRPVPTGDVRYDHRHEWRTGANGAMELNTPSGSSGTEPVLYAELRHLLAGATSVAGAGGAQGFLRNLDRDGALQGLGQAAARYSTFPLGDVRGTLRSSGCAYGQIDAPTDGNIANAIAYLPHVSEGVNREARNEFLCLSRTDDGGQDVISSKTAFIHGVGMTAIDYASASAEGASLIWSPRTNISLYGFTAPVTMARRLGMNIALGTDWPASGSQNMLRELRCAARLDDVNHGDFFTDRELVDMATVNAAAALGSDRKIGSLRAGLEADVAVFDASAASSSYRAIIEGEPATVALVLRSGAVLYGDAETVAALRPSGCEELDVCSTAKRVCAEGDSGFTVAQLRAAVSSNTIELFSCGEPIDEPTCIPFRTGEFLGVPMDGDRDGDGIADALDNCPAVFNPPRPLDGELQADQDGDLDGDVCDVCPLDADSTVCTPPDPDDRDADGIPNTTDNCPDVSNADQNDMDDDQIGDVCDRCPSFANPGNSACPATIYDVKQGNVQESIRVTNALVTAVGPDGYFIQVVDGDADYDPQLGADFSGTFVFDRASPRPAVGDRVDVSGTVNVFFGQTQIAASALEVVATGGPAPTPLVVTTTEVGTAGPRSAALEGVLIEVRDVVVTDAAPDMGQFGEFIVDGNLRVNDFLYLADPFPVMGQGLGYIRGPLRFANDDYKIEPRGPADLDQAPVLVGFEPATGFVLENRAQVSLRLRLNRVVDADTQVQLSPSGPVQVDRSVTVPVGADGVDVLIATGAADVTPAQITATLGMSTAVASLRVYSETEPRSLTSLSLANASVVPGGTVMGTVEIDLPAPAAGQPVSFAVAPSLATADPVTIPAGQRSTSMQVVALATEGTVTVTASVGASSAQANLQIASTVMGTPTAAGDVIITEIMKNPAQVSDAVGEWFEIYNPSGSVIYQLQSCTVSDDGSNSFGVGSSVIVAPGAYVTLAKSAMPGFTPDFVWSTTDLANGDDEVIFTCGGTLIDRVDYTDATHPDDAGRSMQLSDAVLTGAQPHVANDNGANWCSGSAAYNGRDQGTPGSANDVCP